MKPHPRIRKTVKWGGLSTLVLLTAAFAASGWFRASCVTRVAGGDLLLEIGSGRVGGTYWGDDLAMDGRSPVPGVYLDRRVGWRWRHQWRIGPGPYFQVFVPAWMVLIPIGLTTGVTWWIDRRARRRERAHGCAKCGYDRRGLPSSDALCPECGRGSSTSAHRAHTPDGGPPPQTPSRSEASEQRGS